MRLSLVVVASVSTSMIAFVQEPLEAFETTPNLRCNGQDKVEHDLRLDQLSRDLESGAVSQQRQEIVEGINADERVDEGHKTLGSIGIQTQFEVPLILEDFCPRCTTRIQPQNRPNTTSPMEALSRNLADCWASPSLFRNDSQLSLRQSRAFHLDVLSS